VASAVRKLFEYVFGKGLGGEAIRYVAVGAATTLVNYGLFELMWGVLGIGVTASNVTSISVSVLFAYVANKLIVFRRRCPSVGALAIEFSKFIGSRLFTMALEVGAVLLFFNVLGFNVRLVKIAAQVLVIIMNYAISKLIVFRKV
jgi:putative flippase GtrA